MKLSTAILTTGAAVSLTVAGVASARLKQDARHQAERNETILAGNQLDWLAQTSTNPSLAEVWKPEDMQAEEYMKIMSVNRLICMLSLRHRLGFVPSGQLSTYAGYIMKNEVSRRYWERYGNLRAQEAEGNPRAEHFTRVLDQAAKDYAHQPAAA
ncbi:DUF6082 family protein [Streptomyces hundungensis]|uniref:DUF6082 family protein n=1 Tax=Streptomyces hundungensis TaxID=1077946 RepID=UPI0033E5EB94